MGTTYLRDPIVEAILTLDVVYEGEPSVDSLRHLGESLFPDYPTTSPISTLQFVPAQASMNTLRGFGFKNDNRSIKLTTTGFSYHCEKPYISWDAFFPEAYRCWLAFYGGVKITRITKVSLRYLNRLHLPLTADNRADFPKFLNHPPSAPGLDGKPIHGWFFQSVILPLGHGLEAGLTQTSLDAQDGRLPHLIDISATATIWPDKPFELQSVASRLREIKNRIFEDTITDSTRELLK